MQYSHEILQKELSKYFSVSFEKGLTASEVKIRREKYGKNVLPRGKTTGPVKLFLAQFLNPLVIILLLAALLTFVIKEFVDLTVILLAVMVNVSIGFWQEYRSSKIFEKLDKLVTVTAQVRRNNQVIEVEMSELVFGDIILLHADMKVPADARLIKAHDLTLDESLLTGESSAVSKNIVENIEHDATPGDRANMVHMGTLVDTGIGEAIVSDVGVQSEIGKIAELTVKVKDEDTPLQERLSKLGKQITIFVTIFAVIIFVVGLLQDRSITEMFKITIAIAVAAIPEGLPAALSAILAVSATRILKRKGLVKKLVGAETLGSTSVIITDKTGTLTTGKMTVRHLLATQNENAARLAIALASDVTIIHNDKGEIELRGEATDRAKVEYFHLNGGNIEEARKTYSQLAFLPFDPNERYIANFTSGPNNQGKIFVSGAAEALLARSRKNETEKNRIMAEIKMYASRGFRMIGVAEREFPETPEWDTESKQTLQSYVSNLTFLGVAALRDPLRADVKESIEITKKAGIRVIMATGDYRLTAVSIGRDAGLLGDEGSVLDGKDIENMSDEKLLEHLKKVEIFSRVSPEHKMRITEILRKNGEVVAMTGDGVNDAPALKAADIGVALGSGSDITKEAADLVLIDDSFSIITNAVREGRTAFDNMRKVAVFLLSNSFTEIIIILAALFFQTAFLPVTAVQILWANLVEDSFPNFALAFEPGEKDIMKRMPLKRNEPILDKQGLVIIFIVGILSDLMLVGIFLYLIIVTSLSQEHIQTLIFSLLAVNSLFIVFAIKSYHQSLFKTNILDNRYLIAAVVAGLVLMGAAIYAPPLQRLLGTVALSGIEVLMILGVTAFQVLLIEMVKWWFRYHDILGFAQRKKA